MDTYAYDFVKKISFNRVAGTADEKRAAALIQEEIEKLGGASSLLEFEIPSYTCNSCSARALDRDLEVVCYGGSGTIHKECKLLYLDLVNETTLQGLTDLSDTCLLLNSVNPKIYEQIAPLHPAAFMTISGKWYYGDAEEDLVPRKMRERLSRFGKIPGFIIRSRDALFLLQNDCETIHLDMETEETTASSQDVLAVIEGSEFPEESILIIGHYDSVPVGNGAWDNATGAASVLYQYRYFLTHPPKRTLRFVWCGAEEQGLLGARAYVAAHEDLIPQMKFVFNFDMNGTAFGPNFTFITGNQDLEDYYASLCKEYGYATEVNVGIRSSDCRIFAMHGIPSLGISRGRMAPYLSFHTRYDVLDIISPKELNKNLAFASFCIDRFANAESMPVPTGLGPDLQKKLEMFK